MSYWCYQCNRVVNVTNETSLVCPRCSSGFIEAGTGPSSAPESLRSSPTNSEGSDSNSRGGLGFRRRRRRSSGDGVDTSQYNPIILMRSPPMNAGYDASDGGESSDGSDSGGVRLYRLFYNDAGTGLQPLPPSMAEFLLGAGFDRLLDQLSEIEINKPDNNGPASKAAIESMASVEIEPSHICSNLNCAVCHEEFIIGSEAREMPCKHLYHSDCILPWLSIKNSCPICRHELPSETVNTSNRNQSNSDNSADEPFGISIWRLPSGGYAVGRFSGSNNNTLPSSVVLGSRRTSGGMRRLFGGFISVCKRVVSSSWSSLSPPISLSVSDPGSPENLSPRGRSMSIS